jgi:protein phosphatase
VYLINSAALTDRGRKRPQNEDFVEFFEPDEVDELQASGNLYIVADGVGGASKGERASQYAAQKVLYEYYQYPEVEPGERLRQAFRLAGNEVYQYAEESERFMRMATTMVAAVIRGDSLTVANVGDSRAYLIRAGKIQQITQDHSFVGEMVRDNLMTEEEALKSRNKNRITRSLGGELNVKVDIFPDIPLQTGDKILLCSDGLTRYTTRQDLQAFTEVGSPQEIVTRLIDFANRSGGVDNISAQLIEVGQPVDEADLVDLISRGQEPIPVDWETMDTVIYDETPSGSQQQQMVQYLPYIIIAIVVIFGTGILGTTAYYLMRTFNPTDPTSSPQTTTDDNVLIVDGTITPIENINNQEFTPQPTQTFTTTPEPSQTTTPTDFALLTLTSIGTTSTSEFVLILCRYQVKDGDELGKIFENLKIQYSLEEVECANIENNELCTLDNPDYIETGWFLDFSKVNRINCLERGTPVP